MSAFDLAWSLLKAYEVDGKLSMTPNPRDYPTHTDAALNEISTPPEWSMWPERDDAKMGRTAPADRQRNLMRIMADYLGVSEMDALDLMYPQFTNPENKFLEDDDDHIFQGNELSSYSQQGPSGRHMTS